MGLHSCLLAISPLANFNHFMHHCKHTIMVYNTSHFFDSDHIVPSAFLKVESRIWTRNLNLTHLYIFDFIYECISAPAISSQLKREVVVMSYPGFGSHERQTASCGSNLLRKSFAETSRFYFRATPSCQLPRSLFVRIFW